MTTQRIKLTKAFCGATLFILCSLGHAGELQHAKLSSEIFENSTNDPYTLAVKAYIWGYPLLRSAEIRLKTTQPNTPLSIRPPDVPGGALNRIGHQRVLSTPDTRLGVAPNHDTLYSLGWLDLAEEPYILETPEFGNRYYVFQMGQADSSTDVSFGQRSHGGQLPPLFIYGNSFKGKVPSGMLSVKSHYRYLMIAGRIFVSNDSDLPAVHALQNQIKLRPYSSYIKGSDQPAPIPGQSRMPSSTTKESDKFLFMQQLGQVLKDVEPVAQERVLVESFRKIGLTREKGFRIQALSESERIAVAKGLTDGKAIVRSKTFSLGDKVNGWSINYTGSHFGSDYLLRAAVAMDQIYILEAEQALYPSARVDKSGNVLDGTNTYHIHFTKDEFPPVDGFWSISLYYAEGFMVPNQINRWSIGDRTPNLIYNEDGSLDILIQHDQPAGKLAANWLPAPNEPFMLLMRLYLPRESVVNKTWRPPAIEMMGKPGTAIRTAIE